MIKPAFDHDFSRVNRESYITGKAAINFPSTGTTGGWHSLAYFDRDTWSVKLSLAGIQYPETTGFFGDAGIFDATQALVEQGWSVGVRVVWMADHFRATADMVVRWALSDSKHCNVEVSDWFPGDADREHFLNFLSLGKQRLQELGRFEKVERWLRGQ
jgi:hypothetical protein